MSEERNYLEELSSVERDYTPQELSYFFKTINDDVKVSNSNLVELLEKSGVPLKNLADYLKGYSKLTKKVYTTGEAAKMCQVSQQTIIRCFDAGNLKGFKVPKSKFRRIPRDKLYEFMRDNNIPISS